MNDTKHVYIRMNEKTNKKKLFGTFCKCRDQLQISGRFRVAQYVVVCQCCLVTLLNWTSIFGWFVVW